MIFFYFKEAINSFKNAKLATIVTIASTVLAVLLTNASIGILIISNKVDNKLLEEVEINVFVKDDISEKDKNTIEQKLNSATNIKSYRFITKEEAEKDFLAETGESFSSLLEINPLPASFSLKLSMDFLNDRKYIENYIDKLKNLPGVEDVVYELDYLIKTADLLKSSKYFVYAFSIFLIILSVYLIYFTNTLIYKGKENRHKIMALVGADNASIKRPVLIYNLIIAILVSVISMLILYYLIYFVNFIYYYSLLNNNIYYILLSQILFSLLLGLLGNFFSNSKISNNIKIQ